MKKAILIPTISLFLICLVATILLGVANGITETKIKENSIVAKQESQKIVMADAASFGEEIKGVHEFDGEQTPYSYVEALDKDGNKIGYVFVTESTGYGGRISTMTGIGLDGKITGVEFLELNETVGLGMNAQKDSFKDGFKGLDGIAEVIKNTEPQGNQVKALTGATITSKATTKGVNIALDIYLSEFKGGADNG